MLKRSDYRFLNRLLSYRNIAVLRQFSVQYGIPLRESRIIFQDLMRFLSMGKLASKESRPVVANMPATMLVVDEMWHTFILNGADYRAFCMKYFGRRIDHRPAEEKQKKRRFRSTMVTQKAEAMLEETIGVVYDLFGERVVTRWFREYPRKYTKRLLLQRQLKVLDSYNL